ncbi:MAG: GNAT family N-acetyltransferase [Acetatifactor sp.]|nr:GNAT family N-acetyltransferase [Acetatifactor sp.]
MNNLLIKKPIDKTITREQFLEDMDCLFLNLKELYGMYHYFGEEKFIQARQIVEQQIEQAFAFDQTLENLKRELSFIKDGHFYIGDAKPYEKRYDYAIRYTNYKGIPVIDCKKFYHDTEEELEQLKEFAKSGECYRGDGDLILDFRGNIGGSSVYIYEFLEGLLGREESECSRIPNKKKIFVLLDEVTASAAEEGLAVLKNIEDVTIVGEHSAGCASCGNCLAFYLPHSHLKVRFGTGAVLYEGYRNVDAEGGFKGDIGLPAFKKWMEIRTNPQYTIKEYCGYNEAEILPLYTSVGWINYTEHVEMLRLAFEHSLKTIAVYDETSLIGLIRVIGDGHSAISIQDLLVLPEYQGKGVGTALLCEILIRYRDVYQKTLLTDDTEKTVRFYQSMGFRSASDIGCRAFISVR